MTKQDTENLFALLAIYFPNSKNVRNARLKSAWHLLLEPYSPADVKKAVVECLRESSYFPDPQSVAQKVRARAEARQLTETAPAKADVKTLEQLRKLREKMRRDSESGRAEP